MLHYIFNKHSQFKDFSFFWLKPKPHFKPGSYWNKSFLVQKLLHPGKYSLDYCLFRLSLHRFTQWILMTRGTLPPTLLELSFLFSCLSQKPYLQAPSFLVSICCCFSTLGLKCKADYYISPRKPKTFQGGKERIGSERQRQSAPLHGSMEIFHRVLILLHRFDSHKVWLS